MKDLDKMLQGIDAVLFDIDGTLIDSMGVWGDIDRIYLSRYGKEMKPDLQKELAGISIQETADYFRNVIGIDEPAEKMLSDWNELAYKEYHDVVMPKPGALKWVKDLDRRGIKMAVGTSNTRKLAETVLQVRGFMPYFKVILTGEDVKTGKPDPYIYQECALRLDTPPDRCLVFEDIYSGVMAGRNAGMKTCAVWDKYAAYEDAQKRAYADYYIQSFNDIYDNKVEFLR